MVKGRGDGDGERKGRRREIWGERWRKDIEIGGEMEIGHGNGREMEIEMEGR
jgi:hypothetical protein